MSNDDFESRAHKAAQSVRQQLTNNSVDGDLRKVKRSPIRRATNTAVATAAIVAVVALLLPNGPSTTQLGTPERPFALASALKPFDSCDKVLGYFKDHGVEYFLERNSNNIIMPLSGAVEPNTQSTSGVAERAASSATDGNFDSAYSTTNIQEKGVDEPDTVKTDGKRMVVVSTNHIQLLDVSSGTARLAYSIELPAAQSVLLKGDRLLAFGGSQSVVAHSSPYSSPRWGQRSQIALYDIANINSPQLLETMEIEGQIVDARLVDTTIRIATAFSPDVDVPSPTFERNGELSEKSRQQLADAINKSNIDTWIPQYSLLNTSGKLENRGRLVDCEQLAHPVDFSGIDTVSVISLDIQKELKNRKAVGVIAGGQEMYATASTTYITTTKWSKDSSPSHTDIHKFSSDPSGNTIYLGSGTVDGTVLNQYSMSDDSGVLRIATTVRQQRGWINQRTQSEGVVTTLREKDGKLIQLGKVDGLGRQDNETIKSVRFIGELAYVVTFRQTDPLFVIDLHDPEQPKVVGELKIPGYSGYLHPIGDDLLFGVGQGSDANISTQQSSLSSPDSAVVGPTPNDLIASPRSTNGLQFSLFDISNPADPKRIGLQTYPWGYSGAEYDPHAFLYWEPRNLIIAPSSFYGGNSNQFSGLILLQPNNEGLKEAGKIQLLDKRSNVQRSVIIGSSIYLITDNGLQANNLDTHEVVHQLEFPNAFPNMKRY